MRLNTDNTVKFCRKSAMLSATTRTDTWTVITVLSMGEILATAQGLFILFQKQSTRSCPTDGTRDKQQKYQPNVSCEIH